MQNAAARLLLGLSRHDNVRPTLKELHWLPNVYRIQFTLALVMFTIHTRRCPDCLTDSVQASNSDLARTRLCSLTILFHSQEQNIATEPSMWPAKLYETDSLPAAVCEADSLFAYSTVSASSKLICLLSALMTNYQFLYILQTFVMHSQFGDE